MDGFLSLSLVLITCFACFLCAYSFSDCRHHLARVVGLYRTGLSFICGKKTIMFLLARHTTYITHLIMSCINCDMWLEEGKKEVARASYACIDRYNVI
jgi:hypothetical protein